MSTRGLIGFRCNDTDKLIYNHYDSQPDTLGLRILRELRDVDNWNVVLDRAESLIPILGFNFMENGERMENRGRNQAQKSYFWGWENDMGAAT